MLTEEDEVRTLDDRLIATFVLARDARQYIAARTALPEAIEYIEQLVALPVKVDELDRLNDAHGRLHDEVQRLHARIAELETLARADHELAHAAAAGLERRDTRIADLEREKDVLNKMLDVSERELADTRKANEILEAQVVAALGPVRFGPGPEVVDAAEDEARRRGRARRRK